MASWQLKHKGPIYTVSAYGEGKLPGLRDYARKSTAIEAAGHLQARFPYADITVTEYDEEVRTQVWRNGTQ